MIDFGRAFLAATTVILPIDGPVRFRDRRSEVLEVVHGILFLHDSNDIDRLRRRSMNGPSHSALVRPRCRAGLASISLAGL